MGRSGEVDSDLERCSQILDVNGPRVPHLASGGHDASQTVTGRTVRRPRGAHLTLTLNLASPLAASTLGGQVHMRVFAGTRPSLQGTGSQCKGALQLGPAPPNLAPGTAGERGSANKGVNK